MVAAFEEAHPVTAPTRIPVRGDRGRRTSERKRSGRVGRRIAVLGVAGALSMTAAAAATGSLPAPAQSVVHRSLARVGIEVPTSVTEETDREPPRRERAGAVDDRNPGGRATPLTPTGPSPSASDDDVRAPDRPGGERPPDTTAPEPTTTTTAPPTPTRGRGGDHGPPAQPGAPAQPGTPPQAGTPAQPVPPASGAPSVPPPGGAPPSTTADGADASSRPDAAEAGAGNGPTSVR
jgi:hypothetical protein